MEKLKFHCEIATKEVQLVGQSITANFPQHFPDAALQIQTQFVERRHEVINAKNQEVLFSPLYVQRDICYVLCLPGSRGFIDHSRGNDRF
ncbi:hypothetical protein [Paenibacillus ehimensis]|uniref:hypothetical protein n=1 Tax=Paenibacillus ehimensis TaxID=79264 RepID=UPI0020A65620|nr:hypothetical protein [Paenibacillus ehimensis]